MLHNGYYSHPGAVFTKWVKIKLSKSDLHSIGALLLYLFICVEIEQVANPVEVFDMDLSQFGDAEQMIRESHNLVKHPLPSPVFLTLENGVTPCQAEINVFTAVLNELCIFEWHQCKSAG